MYVIVVGCGRVGSELAMSLSKRGHDVTVIDHVGSSFSHLDPAWRGRTIEAEAMAEGVLKRAGVEQADALASVTNSDAVNAVVAHVARTVYKVQSVVSRNYDPRWRPLHEAMGLRTVSSTAWGAQRVEELLESRRMRPVFSAGNGEVELYDMAKDIGQVNGVQHNPRYAKVRKWMLAKLNDYATCKGNACSGQLGPEPKPLKKKKKKRKTAS